MIRIAALAIACALGYEIYGRIRLELDMKAFVSREEPFFLKRLRQIRLTSSLQTISAPQIYRDMVARKQKRKGESSSDDSPFPDK